MQQAVQERGLVEAQLVALSDELEQTRWVQLHAAVLLWEVDPGRNWGTLGHAGRTLGELSTVACPSLAATLSPYKAGSRQPPAWRPRAPSWLPAAAGWRSRRP